MLKLNVKERWLFRGLFAPPPFISRSDRCNLSCSFFITAYINDAQ